MSLEQFTEYKPREFCRAVKCSVQMGLNNIDKPEEYEEVRQTCRISCRYAAWQFHHWLTEKGYLILKPKACERK
jgi:hypothetical protein